MIDDAEKRVSKFYNSVGWEVDGEITEDAKRWEDLREHAKEYITKCRLRVLDHIPSDGEFILDMASGPIQYPEYMEFSKNYKKRYCVDLSSVALDAAKRKIGDHGVFINGSFFDIDLEENYFDCSISLHTVYHMDKDKQEAAVRKLLYVTKHKKPVVIVYSNPNTFFSVFKSFLVNFRLLNSASEREIANGNMKDNLNERLYFYQHPVCWWERFTDVADVKVFPWRSFSSDLQKKLIPNNRFGSVLFKMLFSLENRFPDFFVKYFQYYTVVLTKR